MLFFTPLYLSSLQMNQSQCYTFTLSYEDKFSIWNNNNNNDFWCFEK